MSIFGGFFAGGQVQFIYGNVPRTSGTTAVLNTLGIQVGDFGVAYEGNGSAPITAGGAWTMATGPGSNYVWKRIFNAADIASGLTYTSSTDFFILRGVLNCTNTPGLSGSGGGTISGGAFTRSNFALGIAIFDRNARSPGPPGYPTLLTPSGFTLKAQAAGSDGGGAGSNRQNFLRLESEVGPYTGGSFSFSVPTSGANFGAHIIELLSQ